MFVRTHVRIAEKIAEALRIKREQSIGLLVSGSHLPDDWGDFPHHKGKDFHIITNVLLARKLCAHAIVYHGLQTKSFQQYTKQCKLPSTR